MNAFRVVVSVVLGLLALFLVVNLDDAGAVGGLFVAGLLVAMAVGFWPYVDWPLRHEQAERFRRS